MAQVSSKPCLVVSPGNSRPRTSLSCPLNPTAAKLLPLAGGSPAARPGRGGCSDPRRSTPDPPTHLPAPLKARTYSVALQVYCKRVGQMQVWRGQGCFKALANCHLVGCSWALLPAALLACRALSPALEHRLHFSELCKSMMDYITTIFHLKLLHCATIMRAQTWTRRSAIISIAAKSSATFLSFVNSR